MISGIRKNVFRLKNKKYSEYDIYDIWEKAKIRMWEESLIGKLDYNFWEQEEIMKILNNMLEGFEFYERF